MHRFFVPVEWFQDNRVTIYGELTHQIAHVLRLQTGDRVTLLDNSGGEYEVEIEQIGTNRVMGKVIRKEAGRGEPDTGITLYQALLKVNRMEYVLQKCVELGATDFVPFISERCVLRKTSESKIERWQKIIREAAEQSRRSRLPVLHPLISFQQVCETVNPPAVLLWEEEKNLGLKKILQSQTFQKASSINLLVGPEGGWADSEVEHAREHGIVTAGLGRRILRAETAGLVAISAVLYDRGELG